MLRIVRGRRHGKTYDLIKYAIENDCAIITGTQEHKKCIEDMAMRFFKKRVYVYTINEWREHGRHHINDKYVVDEMEMLMKWMLDGEMVGWNMSWE